MNKNKGKNVNTMFDHYNSRRAVILR